MKKRTSIFLILFFAAAISLFVVIYVAPKFSGGSLETVALEKETLPIADKENVLIVRDETLYLSPYSGETSYGQDDGTKIRKGAPVMSVGNEILEAAKTGTVSFSSDGYEEKLTPALIPDLKAGDTGDIPEKAASLKKDRVQKDDPVYKLTDDALWYMVFWIDGESGSRVHYNDGGTVKVDFGDGEVAAKIDSITDDEGDFRVVLTSDRYYKNMTDIRRADANIIFSENKGLVVDANCIALRDGQRGVFVKQRSGSFKWTPIQIDENASTGEKYIVKAGTYTDENGNEVRTVNYYDEVLKDPKAAGYE
ncbi:MAG: hypothetical protein LBC58_00055 [Clostridiales Family XIII bacterium]|jgi:hypothetical protein|nr:hypothetical protein [Clostridiales Family XIII bacterium]